VHRREFDHEKAGWRKTTNYRETPSMTISTNNLDKRLAQLKKEVPTRGMERHPSVLGNISDLPEELRSPTVTALAVSEAIQIIIAFPPQIHRGWTYVPKQALLFTPNGVIHLLASIWPDREPQVTRVNSSGILYLKVTLLLLYGFLEIVVQGHSSPTQLGVEFNAVAWECLSRPLYRLLQAAKAPTTILTERPAYSPTAQQALGKLPLKFVNGVKIYCQLPGEELEDLVFQPGLWNTSNRWLLWFRKPITANTLLSITSNYLVIIQEELGVAQGWIVSYILRNRIVGMQSRPHGLWNELTVQLKQGDQTAECKLPLRRESIETWRGQWIQHDGQWQDLPADAEK
jgi:hypothetical protein